MSDHANKQDVIDAISRIISRHADWLDGRTFQRLALDASRAYFEEDDLDDYLNAEQGIKAFEAALTAAVGE